jgi:hypothetical protein
MRVKDGSQICTDVDRAFYESIKKGSSGSSVLI